MTASKPSGAKFKISCSRKSQPRQTGRRGMLRLSGSTQLLKNNYPS